MEMINVTSSNIESIGRDEATGVMRVQFSNGGLYEYAGVPVSTWNEFMGAESKGKYFAQNIKGKFDSNKL